MTLIKFDMPDFQIETKILFLANKIMNHYNYRNPIDSTNIYKLSNSTRTLIKKKTLAERTLATSYNRLYTCR